MSEAFPAISIRSYRIELDQNKALTESSFSRYRNEITLAGGIGDRWGGRITTRILNDASRRTFVNFLMKVGLYGRFTMSYPGYAGAASGVTTGAVVGAGQSGTSLLVDGFSPTTLIISKGEFFQVGNEFKRATANSTSNGSGQIQMTFEPALRVSPADDATVTFDDPKLLLELLSNPGESVDFNRLADFTIGFQEALIHE